MSTLYRILESLGLERSLLGHIFVRVERLLDRRARSCPLPTCPAGTRQSHAHTMMIVDHAPLPARLFRVVIDLVVELECRA